MGTLYLTTPDTIVHKVDERLQVRQNKEVVLDLPLLKIEQVVALGRVTLTAALVDELMQRKIGVSYLRPSGRFVARLEPEMSKNVLLRSAQYRAAFDVTSATQLAIGFIRGKLANMRVALNRLQRERPNEALQNAIQLIKKEERLVRHAKSIEEARGHEGSASAAYFGVFNHFIKVPGFTFTHRRRRPPPDPVNALLSFGYAVLAQDLQTACNLVGFDPYLGYLHSERYGRASLALDLMEEFRSLIVDSTVLRCINLKILTPQDFTEELGGSFRLSDNGRKAFLRAYEERKQTELKHPIMSIRVTYKRCFELQARLLARVLTGELSQYPALVVQ
jgi:CRISPR-associated protein Cas1